MAAVLALGNTSCSDFLEVKPAGSVSEQDFVSAKGVEQLVTGMYAKMHDNSYFEATLSNYVYGDVMGGSANKGSTYQDQPDFTSLETYTFTTDNGYLNVKWKKCYNGVFVANNVIKLADMAKEEMSTVNGEALLPCFLAFRGCKIIWSRCSLRGRSGYARERKPAGF